MSFCMCLFLDYMVDLQRFGKRKKKGYLNSNKKPQSILCARP